jgi:enoyl-CoA hydratase/carnithine racemase
LVDRHETVALITLNRPKALNALSDALLADVLHAARVLENDSDIRCLVVTGSKKAFAAGADISEMRTMSFEDVYRNMTCGWQTLTSILKTTPIIAAVSGYCLGGGGRCGNGHDV